MRLEKPSARSPGYFLIISEFCSGCRFFLIGIRALRSSKISCTILNRRQVLLVKCAMGYGTKRVLVDLNFSGRQNA